MRLSDQQVLTLMSAGVLFGRTREVLSSFEQQLVAEVGWRFVAFKAETVVTDAEWPVIEDAITAMRGEMARRLDQVSIEVA